MGDAASAVMVGACTAVAAISFGVAYLTNLLIPVTYKATLGTTPSVEYPKDKTEEQRVEIIEKKDGISPPIPSAPQLYAMEPMGPDTGPSAPPPDEDPTGGQRPILRTVG
jgi:hypothetical protein